MARQRVLRWYHNYALAIGVSSHKLVAGKLRQTRISRYYALVLNAIQLVLMPTMYWLATRFIRKITWFPKTIPFTATIMYAISCATVIFTIMSRGYRDSGLLEVERIVSRVKRLNKQHFVQKKCTICTLYYQFYIKLTTMLYLCLISLTTCFLLPNVKTWPIIISCFFFSNGMNMPVVATHRYFLALWNIASCYKIINGQLETVIRNKRFNIRQLNELRLLWQLHSLLGRCFLKLNKIFNIMMLLARFDHLSFSVINFYWGLLFAFSMDTPFYVLVVGALFFSIRTLDFFLIDKLCDLSVQYQNGAYHILSEGNWYKELNAFMLYVSTSKLSIWVCGLYKSNLELWFQSLGTILSFSILLLQFHLILNDKYSL